MPLERGEVQSYNVDRIVVEFTLLNQGKVILCAISTAALSSISRASAISGDASLAKYDQMSVRSCCAAGDQRAPTSEQPVVCKR
ncbi:MAG: hypothetical protein ABSD31_19715 [Candidatus Binataceae bacterium]